MSLCKDVTTFAYINLRNKEGKAYKLFDYQDIIVNSQEKRIIVAKGRKIGATDIISILALYKALIHPNWEIVVASKTQDMAKRIIDRVKLFLKTCPAYYDDPNLKGLLEIDNRFEIWLKHGKKGEKTAYSKIISVVAGESARGVDPDLLIVDEAAFIGEGANVKNADYIYKEILEPSVTFKNGQIFLISTPPKLPVGFFWEAFNSPYWKKFHFPTSICPIVTEEFLQQRKDEMTDAAFRREHLGEFFADEATYFSQREIDDAIDSDIVLGQHTEQTEYIGVDWGETQSQCARVHVIAENRENPKEMKVKVINLVEYPKKTDYKIVVGELEDIYKRKRNINVLADAGIGRGQISWLKSFNVPVQEYSFSGTRKGDLFTELKILFEKRKILIPNNKQLINELTVYQADYDRVTQRVKYHAPKEGKIADHVLDALALACFAAVRMGIKTSLSFVPHSKVGDKPVELGTRTCVCPSCNEYHQAKASVNFEEVICRKCQK